MNWSTPAIYSVVNCLPCIHLLSICVERNNINFRANLSNNYTTNSSNCICNSISEGINKCTILYRLLISYDFLGTWFYSTAHRVEIRKVAWFYSAAHQSRNIVPVQHLLIATKLLTLTIMPSPFNIPDVQSIIHGKSLMAMLGINEGINLRQHSTLR